MAQTVLLFQGMAGLRVSALARKPMKSWSTGRGFLLATIVIFSVEPISVVSVLGSERLIRKGYDITETGLVPTYPTEFDCPPLTSLYASWIDVDGTKRDEQHSGIDLGRLNDRILAPASSVVRAAWETDWQWGREGALLLRHSREDLGMTGGARYYYSEFDHLRYRDIRTLQVGEKIARGHPLAIVARPGGRRVYLPEVHWEVWEVKDDDALEWHTNKYGGRYWVNETARLIDPLYMMGLNDPPGPDRKVVIIPFEANTNYHQFRGFTYALQCQKR
jgi:hypothetical protein